MDGKIGLEEHFALPETLQDSSGFLPPSAWPELSSRLLDDGPRRLAEMDANGMSMMILSLNAPAVQAIEDPKRAAELARKANDNLAEKIARRRDRFRGLAALPLQDPDMAAHELTRAIRELGFVGALANGFSQRAGHDGPVFYDLPEYRDFWSVCAALNVPFYLHPRNPLPQDARIYAGHPWLMGPGWAFAQETAVHALRLMASGLFDTHPRLQIILGHNLPFSIWRADNHNAWAPNANTPPARKRLSDYFRQNFYVTISGNHFKPAFDCALSVMGPDRILFSTDWPFENVDHAANWFDTLDLPESDRQKIGRLNAMKLFGLDLG